MTEARAIFLDVDGTYALHGQVPDAHVAAVRAARAAGHKVLLCTGRPVSALTHHLVEAGFDGYVAAAGAYVEIDGAVVANENFPSDLAVPLLAQLDEHGVAYIVENSAELLLSRRSEHLLPRAVSAYGGDEADVTIEVIDDLSEVGFAKLVCFGGDLPLADIIAPLGAEVAVVPNSIPDLGPGAGEIYQARISKAVGIEVALESLGMTRAQTVAFGDGLNDLEMLQFAPVSVAIDGSDPRVLEAATHRAAPPNENGLAAAFAELGLV